MEKLKKYKVFMSDMLLNMIGFGIYIVAQQILLLPLLAKMVNDEMYSSIVLYLSILNVVCNVTGGELGNVRLIRDYDYQEKNIKGDFVRILLVISFIITVILLPIFICYIHYSVIGSILLVVTILMANLRLYGTCYYRLQQQYGKVIWQNVCYLIGMVTSLGIFKFCENIYLLLLIPEFVSMMYALKNSDILQMKLVKTTEMIHTVKKYFQLGFVSMLTNLMAYFDKFLIYPIFGATLVAVYYAVNSMSKIANLITNPIANVILSWVSGKRGEKNKSKIIRMTLFMNVAVVLIVTLLTIPLTYLSLKILYHQYFSEALVLIIPISITAAFGTAVTLMKSVLLKFSNTNQLVGVYFVYFILFVLFGYFLSKANGILGFAIANLMAKIGLWLAFIGLLIQAKKEKIGEENEVNESNKR